MTVVQAEPLIMTYMVTETVPMIAATSGEMVPQDAEETMIPSPWNWSVR